MRRFSFVLSFLFLCQYLCLLASPRQCFSSAETVIDISSQKQFDALDQSISSAIAKGKKKIKVSLAAGNYSFVDGHLKLDKLDSSVELNLVGNGSVLYSRGVLNPSSVNPEKAYLDAETLMPLNLWSKVYQMDRQIEVADKGKKLCKIKLSSCLSAKVGDWIQISRWFTSSVHQISKVSGGYVFFEVSDLSYSLMRLNYNINADYSYAKINPRYRILSAQALKGKKVYECQAINFINANDKKVKSITIQDIDFRGCAYTNWKGLIRLNGIEAKSIEVSNCSFRGCRSAVLNINNTSNLICKECIFEGNYDTCINSDNRTRGTQVLSCVFKNNGLSWNNVFDVAVAGENFYVADNVFSNFVYSAIAIGVYWESTKKGLCSGIVENNEIYYTADYFDSKEQHTLMDSGAIYLLTQNDDVKIRFNCIHDITGMSDNRGIFCDDGAYGFSLIGNVIYNIENSYCIDSRKVSEVESKTGKYNVDNVIRDNVIDGSVRFEGNGKENNGCIKGRNLILSGKSVRKSGKFNVSGVEKSESDVNIVFQGVEDGKLVVDKESMRIMKKSSAFKGIKKYFK